MSGEGAIVRDPASWRDPSGHVYRRDGVLYRLIARSFADDWGAFASSKLAARLVTEGRLIPWVDAPDESARNPDAAAVIRPEPVDFISYPYEWTFSQLRDAALLTLDAETDALEAGFSLKDASAYNVQFRGVRPVLIDHLSFERAAPDTPWIAYRQFCEHFLAPLALMAHRDIRLGLLLRAMPDGIPLDLAATLLPGRTRWRLGLASHIHLHARAQRQHADDAAPDSGVSAAPQASTPHLSTTRLRALLMSLRSAVTGLRWEPSGTEWADYAERDHVSYADATGDAKAALVGEALEAAGGGVCWDLGANTGRFSRIAAARGARVLAFDIDPAAAERHYRSLRAESSESGSVGARTTPLVMDLADPSPSLGWAERERRGLLERADADVVLALALVHHLAIGRNVPLPMVLGLFADLAPQAIVEWVPREDPMVRRMLASREDIFDGYTEDGFREAAQIRFEVAARDPIEGSSRVLYRLARRA